MESTDETHTAKVALVGDRSPHVRSHTRTAVLLDSLRRRDKFALDAYWVPTEEAHATTLDRLDAIWLLPGSPYRSGTGALGVGAIMERHHCGYGTLFPPELAVDDGGCHPMVRAFAHAAVAHAAGRATVPAATGRG
ncbi:hypothetical protein [Streptomyces deccanensis]|uniref:hypothetical protein n=1 Tax=Streptomyces deccanensis TaxID=424188 RepID=UPI001EFACCE2|nr:hypothetical protein [Streptomyces deccanensis]ULR55080.1 hypothetical protein L3078_40605 [Streptomyces deccanensis]